MFVVVLESVLLLFPVAPKKLNTELDPLESHKWAFLVLMSVIGLSDVPIFHPAAELLGAISLFTVSISRRLDQFVDSPMFIVLEAYI